MKLTMFAATIMLGAAPLAAQTGTYEPMRSGDELTRQGTNPEGQPCTPAGYNVGLNVYPACAAMGGPNPWGIEDYPPCTQQITDRCIQTYTRWTRR